MQNSLPLGESHVQEHNFPTWGMLSIIIWMLSRTFVYTLWHCSIPHVEIVVDTVLIMQDINTLFSLHIILRLLSRSASTRRTMIQKFFPMKREGERCVYWFRMNPYCHFYYWWVEQPWCIIKQATFIQLACMHFVLVTREHGQLHDRSLWMLSSKYVAAG